MTARTEASSHAEGCSHTTERIVVIGEALDENVYYLPNAAGATKTDTPLIETPQSVTITPVKGLNIIADYTLQDVEITASNAGDEGKHPVATPKHLASLWADYTLPDGPLKGFGFGGGVRYQGSSFGDAANKIRSESFVVGDAVVHYEWRGVRAAVNVQNVTDERYFAAIQNGSSFYGAARTVVGSVRYAW